MRSPSLVRESSYEDKGSLIKWNPAIKTRFDRDALINAVNNNTIDIVATDHAPHTLAEKDKHLFQVSFRRTTNSAFTCCNA